MKYLLMLLAAVCSLQGYSQSMLLPNEQRIYSFKTKNGKEVMLAKDKGHAYIIYRFGTKDKIEMEFPAKTKESWKMFKYSFYLRGGGIQNDGMDLNSISFLNKGFQYIIYHNYYAVHEKVDIGVKVKDIRSGKVINITGDKKTEKGSLFDFRDNGLLEITEDLFE